MQPAHDMILSDWFARLAEPVEGGSHTENSWLQGYSTAEGLSAIFQLLSCRQSASEVVDRKAAYSMAIFSLYIAVISLILSVIFGLLTLR